MTDPVLFDSGIPSNFHQAPIILILPVYSAQLGPCVVPSNEHGFQLIKDLVAGGYNSREIIEAATAAEAKRIGRQVVSLHGERKKYWDEQMAWTAMFQVNTAKYAQHEYCREWLLGTGDALLVEHRPDPIWGDNMDGTGRNQLGKILMIVREMLR